MTLGGQTTNEANKAKKLLSDLDDIDKKIKENEEILSMVGMRFEVWVFISFIS